jgi:hypothetical protein
MNGIKAFALGVAVLCMGLGMGLAGCSSIQVSSQQHPNADLASLRTFEWQRPRPGGPTNSIIDAQIENAVAANLGQIGVKPVPEGGHPDFIISYNTSVLSIVGPGSSASVGMGMGMGSGRGAGVSRSVGVGFSAPIAAQPSTQERGTVALSFKTRFRG